MNAGLISEPTVSAHILYSQQSVQSPGEAVHAHIEVSPLELLLGSVVHLERTAHWKTLAGQRFE